MSRSPRVLFAGLAALVLGWSCLSLLFFEHSTMTVVGLIAGVVVFGAIASRPFHGLLLLIAVLFLRPADRFESLQPLHLVLVMTVLTLGFMLAQHVLAGRPRLVHHGIQGLLAGLLAVATLSTVLPMGLRLTATILMDGLASALLIYVLVAHLVSDPSRMRLTVWVMTGACAANSLLAIAAARAGENVFHGRIAAVGTLSDPNDLALTFVMVMPLAIALLRSSPRMSGRVAAALCIACLLAGVLASQSRGGLLGLTLVLFKEGYDRLPTARHRRQYAVVATLLAVLALNLLFLRRGKGLLDVFHDENAVGRRVAWSAGLKMLRDYPVTGVGLDQFPDHFNDYMPPGFDQPSLTAHNSIVLVAGELGIPGLLLFLPLLVAIWRAAVRVALAARAGVLDVAWQGARNRELYAALPRAFLGWFVCAMFLSQSFHAWLYLLVGLIVASDVLVRRAGEVRP